MELYFEDVIRAVTVRVITPVGAVDSSNFRQLVASAEQAYKLGREFILLDLSRVHYMSSAGILALNLIGKLYLGEKPPQADPNWQSMQRIKKERSQARILPNRYVKLFQPQEQVEQVIKMVGFDTLFEVFQDRDTALASFRVGDRPRKA